MLHHELRDDRMETKVRFIGVGTIGIAAIWTLLILFKPMIEGMVHSFRMLKAHKLNQNIVIDITYPTKPSFTF